jgi:predicted dehydrogenase
VENEDYVTSLLRFASGARGVLEASRVSVGEQNNYGFEIHGTKGAVFWDFRRMNELGVSLGSGGNPAYQDQAVTTVYVGPSHGFYGAFQPGSASSMGYDDLKVIEAKKFLVAVTGGEQLNSTIDEALADAEVIAAAAASAIDGQWHKVSEIPGATFGHPRSGVPAHA